MRREIVYAIIQQRPLKKSKWLVGDVQKCGDAQFPFMNIFLIRQFHNLMKYKWSHSRDDVTILIKQNHESNFRHRHNWRMQPPHSTRANFSSVHIMYILKQDVLNFSWSEYRAEKSKKAVEMSIKWASIASKWSRKCFKYQNESSCAEILKKDSCILIEGEKKYERKIKFCVRVIWYIKEKLDTARVYVCPYIFIHEKKLK
jgi:hypothetical protein